MTHLEQALADLLAERGQMERRMATLDQAVTALQSLIGESPPHAGNGIAKGVNLVRRTIDLGTPGDPRGQQAIATVLREANGEWMHVKDINAATQARGWGPESSHPTTATRTSADRLVTRHGDEFERSNGRYRWKGEPMDEIEWEEDEEGAVSTP